MRTILPGSPSDATASLTLRRKTVLIEGKTEIRLLNSRKDLKQKPYWGNLFWVKGYCVDTVGLDAEKIRKYVNYQVSQEKRAELHGLF